MIGIFKTYQKVYVVSGFSKGTAVGPLYWRKSEVSLCQLHRDPEKAKNLIGSRAQELKSTVEFKKNRMDELYFLIYLGKDELPRT